MIKPRLLLRPVLSIVLIASLLACSAPSSVPEVAAAAAAPVDAQATEIPAADAAPAVEAAPVAPAAVAEPTPPAAVVPARPRNGWVARFFWSPEYCDKNAGNKELQCNPQLQGFVLRDLIRVVNGRDVDDCAGGSLLMSPEMLEQVSRFTKNRAETRASWRLYGRCSGLSEIDYASWTEFVDRRMSWPDKLVPGGKNVSTTAAELAATLAADNAGLTAETVVFQCNRAWLKSVDLCLDANFQYDKASCPTTSSCGSIIKVLGKP